MPSGIYIRTKEMYDTRRGIAPWNKDTKGICKSNIGSFKKGHIPWNKGKTFPELSRENSYNWKGGRSTTQGYIRIYLPEHPFASYGYVFEHRLVMEEHLGRYLTSKEVVHHKNGNRADNRLENLKLFNGAGDHLRMELTGQDRGGRVVIICANCFKEFVNHKSNNRKYCDRKCYLMGRYGRDIYYINKRLGR